MRSRWEEREGADLDAPATITERELRALRRRAGFGFPAVLLALLAAGGVAWTLLAGPEGLEKVQEVKERLLVRTALAEAPAEPPEQAVAPTSAAPGDSSVVDSMKAAPASPASTPR